MRIYSLSLSLWPCLSSPDKFTPLFSSPALVSSETSNPEWMKFFWDLKLITCGGGGGRQGEERKSVLESPTELRLAKEHFTGVSQLLASLGT